MASKFLLLFFLGAASADRLRFHLENLVDRNVSACDDFYHHVCSQQVDPKEFFFNRAGIMFQEALDRLHPDAIKNSPIEFDIQHVIEDLKHGRIKFDENKFAKLVKSRCKGDINCYKEEVQYYDVHFRLLNITFNPPSIFDTYEDASPKKKIKIFVVILTKMIKSLVKFANRITTTSTVSFLEKALQFHACIHTRMDMIDLMKTNKTYGDLHEIKEAAEILKNRMINNINSTSWLSGDVKSDFMRQKIKERIASIEVFHDFDETDRNMTIMQKLNRDLNDVYFSVKKETGVHSLDVLLRLAYAYAKLFENKSPEMLMFINRITQNFGMNAYFQSELKTVTMLAPFMAREVYTTDIFEEPFFTYFVLSHELHHSLFSPRAPLLLELFKQKTKCIVDHYAHTCSKFAIVCELDKYFDCPNAQGACGSGQRTITEDGPDLESFRVLHSLLLERYTSEQLNAKIDGLETTLEQAFFYYIAGGFCAKDGKRSKEKAKDVHSADNIRMNAALSLMPEFTTAFKCKKGDAMFTDEDKCHVFGPKA